MQDRLLEGTVTFDELPNCLQPLFLYLRSCRSTDVSRQGDTNRGGSRSEQETQTLGQDVGVILRTGISGQAPPNAPLQRDDHQIGKLRQRHLPETGYYTA